MHDMDKRQETMQRDVSMTAIAGLSLVNGMHFSPWFDPVAVLLRPFLAGTMLGSPIVSLYITSFFLSAMTLLAAGVPAALYERFRGNVETSPTSLYIWLVASILFTMHALLASVSS